VLNLSKDFDDIMRIVKETDSTEQPKTEPQTSEKPSPEPVIEKPVTEVPKAEFQPQVSKVSEDITIPLATLNILKKWANVLEDDLGTLKSKAITIFSGIEDDITTDLKWKRVISKLRQEYAPKGHFYTGNKQTFKGFVCAVSSLTDFQAIAKAKANKYEEEHGRQAAVDAGLVDIDGNVLDTQEERFGRTNTNYGSPLGASYRMVLAGFASPIDENNFQWFELEMTGDQPVNFKYGVHLKSFTPCIFTCLDKTTDKDSHLILRSNVDTYNKGFQPYPENDIDVEEHLRNHEYVKLGSLETVAARLEANKDYTTVVGIEVTINGTTPNLTRNNQRMFFVEDETLDINESAMLVTQEQYLPYNVSKNARAYVFGRPFIMKGERKGVGFNSYGAYPIHVFKDEENAEEKSDMFVTWSG